MLCVYFLCIPCLDYIIRIHRHRRRHRASFFPIQQLVVPVMPSAPKPATDLREHHVLALRTRTGVPCTGRESIQHLLHNEICMHATAHASAGKYLTPPPK
ncbi:hypothetical protein PMIN04_004358 [Paraphaeosphaeria minitans]